MALYRGATKLAGIGKGFNPENSGTEGQFLKKTPTGYAYDDIPEVTVDSALSDTSENPVQNKVITNALQNVGGSSDHLETKAPIGELYQLTDTMFLQSTPTLANSTVEQKVGDTADNTQIHIQRIASGTGSNELKLKVKKVGTPGDLSVQVMSGIQVTVTANVEAYWYGDSNNILASGTVLASSITTSWQEITVTLDDEVGGTEGELLNIVLSIPSVNASNYVVIACDSTQWSEGFSLVAVNGSTRTRSKVMPYCVSDGFAQGLLCKCKNNPKYTYYTEIASGSKAVTIGFNSGGATLANPTKDLEIGVTYQYRLTGNITAGEASTEYYLYNGYIGKGTSISAKQGTFQRTSASAIVDRGLYAFDNYYAGKQRTVTWSKIEIYTVEYGKSLPRELKSIGEIGAITIFGTHIDGTRLEH